VDLEAYDMGGGSQENMGRGRKRRGTRVEGGAFS
jgi:hypothetical protein